MSQKEEQEANQFAMELLMPEELFIAEAKKQREKIFKNDRKYYYVNNKALTKEEFLIHKLAIKCQVSEDAVKTRMFNLGILTSL